MSHSPLESLDFTRAQEPEPLRDPRADLVAWLRFQRHEFLRKLRDLSPDQLAEWSVPPVQLSILGLVRHMRQMEHHYLSWGLGGGARVDFYGEDDYPGGSAGTVDEDLAGYLSEVIRADSAVAALSDYDAIGLGHGRPLGPRSSRSCTNTRCTAVRPTCSALRRWVTCGASHADAR